MPITRTPLVGFPWDGTPFTHITPFTHRDGLTYLRKLEMLQAWLYEQLVPWINKSLDEYDAAFKEEISALVTLVNEELNETITNVNTALANQTADNDEKITGALLSVANSVTNLTNFVNTTITSQTEYVNNKVETFETHFNETVEMFLQNSLESNDPMVATMVRGDTETGRELSNRYKQHISVRQYGAVGDGVTDDTNAIKAAIAAAVAGPRGSLWFPPGEYIVSDTLTLYSNVGWYGAGPGSSRIKLKAATNKDLVRSNGFSSYTGTNVQSGPDRFIISGIRLDGNGLNQTAESWTFRVFARCYTILDTEFINGYSGNVFTEWGTGGTDMESHWQNFKVGSAVNGPGMDIRGPHDSEYHGGFVYKNGEATSAYDGIVTSGNAGGDMFSNVHVWGSHKNGFNLRKLALAASCVSEGAVEANVIIASARTKWEGHIYGRSVGDSAVEVGLQIGDATSGPVTGYSVNIATWNYANVASLPIKLVTDSGGTIIATVNKATAAAVMQGTRSPRSQILVTNVDSDNTVAQMPRLTLAAATNQFTVTDGSNTKFRIAGATVQIGNGSQVRGYSDEFTLQKFALDGGTGYIQPGTTGGLGAKIYSGGNVPGFAADDGSFHFRTDGVAGACIYQRRNGVWVAVA